MNLAKYLFVFVREDLSFVLSYYGRISGGGCGRVCRSVFLRYPYYCARM